MWYFLLTTSYAHLSVIFISRCTTLPTPHECPVGDSIRGTIRCDVQTELSGDQITPSPVRNNRLSQSKLNMESWKSSTRVFSSRETSLTFGPGLIAFSLRWLGPVRLIRAEVEGSAEMVWKCPDFDLPFGIDLWPFAVGTYYWNIFSFNVCPLLCKLKWQWFFFYFL